MVDFGGWEMPQQYSSIRDEHLAVRKVAGLFDVSHMGRFRLKGDGGLEFLQSLLTNDLTRIGPGRAQPHEAPVGAVGRRVATVTPKSHSMSEAVALMTGAVTTAAA